jgi:hypothetical protein
VDDLTVLRAYDEPTLGDDGYPLAWHDLGDGRGGIKHLVRDAAGHRCIRCGHPYRCGETPGEWSPCDEHCRHGGPARARTAAGVAADWDEITPGPLWDLTDLRPPDAVLEARWRVLTVHHLDGEKANCRWWNLAALCQRCHLTIQGKVIMDRRWLHEHSPWFRPYAAGYYAQRYLGVDLTRGDVEQRLDELLALEARQLSVLEPVG